MKKLLPMILGSLLFGQQAFAVTVMGEDFAAYASSLNGSSGDLVVDLGGPNPNPLAPNYSIALADSTANITDLDARTWVVGNNESSYLDLSFNTGVVDRTGDDLKVFLVGGNDHKFDLTIGGVTQTYTVDASANTILGEFDSIYGTDPIIAYGIDLADFSLSGPVTQFRMSIGYGWCNTDSGPCSAVPSFIGAYNAVPVPAAVWLFGSGLLGLVGFMRRRA